jgi:hypothetical protein
MTVLLSGFQLSAFGSVSPAETLVSDLDAVLKDAEQGVLAMLATMRCVTSVEVGRPHRGAICSKPRSQRIFRKVESVSKRIRANRI